MPDSNRLSLPRVGFIGLGGMGLRMAFRLLTAGYHAAAHVDDDLSAVARAMRLSTADVQLTAGPATGKRPWHQRWRRVFEKRGREA